uniref:NADH-ubiquinone oxidoreductase chain 3 n=1 Tax=Myrmecophilus manni TaxID=270849 RepID=B6DE93_9ORTH|nr:NADH dehydrogenase subunit 3 [Myrmecophilus manni]ACG59289.1 NADH dehydrogenase subunit 3 [Myrmecophilus manni]
MLNHYSTYLSTYYNFSQNNLKENSKKPSKSSPFECGFDPMKSARTPFSLQFFMIAVIFLIFDVEIALLMPIIPIMATCDLKLWLSLSTIFILILLLGLYYEWAQGALEWAN